MCGKLTRKDSGSKHNKHFVKTNSRKKIIIKLLPLNLVGLKSCVFKKPHPMEGNLHFCLKENYFSGSIGHVTEINSVRNELRSHC